MKKSLLCLAALLMLMSATPVPTLAAPNDPICPPYLCK